MTHVKASFDFGTGIIVQVEESEVLDLGFSYHLNIYDGTVISSPWENSRHRLNVFNVAERYHDAHMDSMRLKGFSPKFNREIKVVAR